MDDFNSIFDKSVPDSPEIVEDVAVEAPVELPQEEVPAVEEPKPVEEREDGAKHVPLSTFLDIRDREKEATRRAAELERQLAERDAKPANTPDPYDDPEGYAAHTDAKIEQALIRQKFELSDTWARQQHGAEAVETAATWAMEKAKNDPTFHANYMRQAHPMDWIVAQHKRDGMLSEIGDDPVAYARMIAEREGWLNPAPPVAAATTDAANVSTARKPAPPRSIASDAPASAPVPADGRDEFLAIFQR